MKLIEKNKIKNFIKIFIPPILLIIKEKVFDLIIKHKFSENLFDGYNLLFKKSLSSNCVYGEYGCGQSTIYVLKKFNIPIFSVDSSKYWINKLKKIYNKKKLNINYIDVGNINPYAWGTPDNFSKRYNFYKYAQNIWKQKLKPNVVLIDGRFRVLCFLTSLKLCDENTKIIFDDYIDRKIYHVVEELIKPTEKDGRQALFIVNKKKINFKKLELLLDKFEYIWD